MDKYRVQPGESLDLAKCDPNDKSLFDIEKAEGKKILLQLNQELENLQELLYAEGKHKLLNRAPGYGHWRERRYHSPCF